VEATAALKESRREDREMSYARWRPEHPIFAIPKIVRACGILRPRELEKHLMYHPDLAGEVRSRKVVRLARGLYVSPGVVPSPEAIAAKRVDHGIICLQSALFVHGLMATRPDDVWVAIGPKDRRPKTDAVPMRIVRFSGRALHEGIEVHPDQGVDVRVYGVEKTIADCFKYRHKIGAAVGMDALRKTLEQNRCDLQRLEEFAAICRVGPVVKRFLPAGSAT
jgi:predicted transcriptional regulator of viral defense system